MWISLSILYFGIFDEFQSNSISNMHLSSVENAIDLLLYFGVQRNQCFGVVFGLKYYLNICLYTF